MKKNFFEFIALVCLSSFISSYALAIVGGKNVAFKQVPWFVKVHMQTGSCGGAIIGKKTILTAAHCVAGRWGEPTFVSGGGDGSIGSLKKIGSVNRTSIVVHEGYSTHEVTINDVAILYLKEDIVLSDDVKKIELLNPNTLKKINLAKMKASIAGFGNGSSYNLGVVGLDIAPSALNKTFWVPYFSNERAYQENLGILGHSVFLTFPITKLAGPCDGDSGGPLTVEYQAKSYLIGITSFVRGKCGQLAGYSSVPFFYNWISSLND